MGAINVKFSMEDPSSNMPFVLIIQVALLTTPSICLSHVAAVKTLRMIVLTRYSKWDTIPLLVAQISMMTIGIISKLILTIYMPP